jgi:O-antigen/teichoic acid export membrane protein
MSRRDLAGPRLTFAIPARLAPFRWTLGATAGLFSASVITSATGFVFWWLAARQFPPEALGLAGAAVSAMLFLSQIAVLGLGTALAGVIHQEERPASLTATALVAAGLAGTVLGLAFALLAPLLSADFEAIRASPLPLVIFVIGVSLTAMVAVTDQVLIALSHRLAQLVRNTVFGVSRLILLVLAAVLLAPEGTAIYAAWLAGTVVSVLVLVPLLTSTHGVGQIWPLMWHRLRSMASDALNHHVVNLSRSAAVWLLPVLVTVTLSSEANAGFYVAFLMANLVVLVGKEATFTLYIVGARAPETLWRQARFTFGVSTLATIAGTVILTVFGEQLLSLFGAEYAESAYPTVAILTASALPVLVKDHWVAIHRVRGSVRIAAVVGVVMLVIELAAAVLGAIWGEAILNDGILGLALFRLVALIAEAILMAPTLIRAMAPPSPATAVAIIDTERHGAEAP